MPETNQLSLAISLPLRNEQALGRFLKQIYDPASPNYHHYLTPGQFTAQFGPSQQDYDTVVGFARSNGLVVARTYSDRTLVDISGTVGSIERAFHTTLRVYPHPTEHRAFFAPDTDPVIHLGVPINHVDGLDNFIIPRPAIRPATPRASQSRPALGSGPNGEYMGKDFHAAYAPGVALNGAGQTVGLFELDGYDSSDITFYEQTNKLPITTLQNIAPDGTVSAKGSGVGEVSLDIEMVVSMATNLSKVIVYEVPNNSSYIPGLLSRIATDNTAKQISSSWLIGDSPSYDTYYQEMAADGQSFYQASGDDGAYYSGISEWADDTNIITVGGTTLSTAGPAGAWSSETVWNWGTAGSGGGVNFNGVPIPSWQQPVGMTNNQGSTTLRNVPDVALTADNIYIVYSNGKTEDVGGTSCAAPLWAAFTALINQQAISLGESTVGFINPAVYAIGLGTNYTNCFHDIATGNNTNTVVGTSEYYASTGYDLCTGWGTPNGSNLINALTIQPNALTITPGTGFAAIGPFGGPFTPASQVYSLTNTGSSSLNWSLGGTPSWLVASITNGTLAAGKSTNVTISVSAGAGTLATGAYAATVTFTNLTSSTILDLPFALQVVVPLIITPDTGFTATGLVGGPFSPASQIYSLTNTGSSSFNWSLSNTSSWLVASITNVTLAAGKGTNITISVTADANILPAGAFADSVTFTNGSSGTTESLQFVLQAIPRPNFLGIPRITGNAFSLTWNTLSNVEYQLQYSTNLASTNWFILKTYNAAGPTLTVTNPVGTSPGTFYRLLLLP